jgi:hypothetical protein
MSPDEITDINRLLANPSEFDLVNSEKLGLFVVSSLAARHRVHVSLRRSAYGGTTAIVLLPFGVIVRAEEDGSAVTGYPDGAQSLRPDLGRPEAEPRSPEPRDWSPFRATGLRRLPAAATGRRVDTGEIPRIANQEWPPAPRTAPRSRWEYQPPPQQQQPPQRPELPMPPWDAVAATPWLEPGRPGPVGQAAPYPADPDGQNGTPLLAAPEAEAPDTAGGTHLGMPIRVPQTSLAPQLRPGSDSGPQSSVREAPEVEQRAPEATRDMLMTMQQGWQRGRLDHLDDLDDSPGQGTDR